MPSISLKTHSSRRGASEAHKREYDRVIVIGEMMMGTPPNSKANPGESLAFRNGEGGGWDVYYSDRIVGASGVREEDIHAAVEFDEILGEVDA